MCSHRKSKLITIFVTFAVDLDGVEPSLRVYKTRVLTAERQIQIITQIIIQNKVFFGGLEGSRTPDFRNANAAFYQLNYEPCKDSKIKPLNGKQCLRGELNSHPGFRKPMLYPLNYGDKTQDILLYQEQMIIIQKQ